MSEQSASRSPAAGARDVLSPPKTVLLLAWIVWGSGALLALGLFVFGLSARFHQLAALAIQAAPTSQRVTLGPLTALLRATLTADVYPVIVLTQEILLVVGLTLVGLVLFWRKPRQWPAMLFSLAMISYGPYISGSLGALQTVHPDLRIVISFVQALAIGSAVLSGYLFPDGRFIPPWTRQLSCLWAVWILVAFVFPDLPLNFMRPFAIDVGGLVAVDGWLITTLAAQTERYRFASGQMQRRQTRWVLLCMTSTIVTFSVFSLPRVLSPTLARPSGLFTLIGYPLFLFALPLSPTVIFIAILRYHLFDIDTVVNRALVYGSLTLVLGAFYAASIVLLQFALSGLTSGSELALVGSTLATAALFQPLRSRIQQSIDRRFYRRKYDAAKTVSEFAATLRNQVELEQVCERLVAVAEETMRPSHISLWLRPDLVVATSRVTHSIESPGIGGSAASV